VDALCLYNYNALDGLMHDGPPLSLRALDLQLGDDPQKELLARMLPPSRVPALRRLDLARNEALRRDSVFELVAANPIVRQLAWLRVPSLRSDADLDAAERAVAALPTDGELIVARAYADHAPARAPSPRLRMPPSRPWPPSDLVRGRLTIVIPGRRDSSSVDLGEAIRLMDARFDTLAEAPRVTWIALWHGVRALTADSSFELSATALGAALAGLELDAGYSTWAALRAALADRTGDTLVVRRWSLWS
jgi:hypothetical protein